MTQERLPKSVSRFQVSASWNIYLSGEIHTNWRELTIDGVKSWNSATFTSAVTDHSASDAAGDH